MILKKRPLPELLILVLIPAIVYLPNIGHLTYFKDDWYYVYDAMIAGAKVFHPMFSIDRPARGYFFEIYFSLFGPHALPYHVGAFLWRVLAAVGAFWIFSILWPRARKFSFWTALLFAVYPGYFWWISAIEYQPMIASLAFQVFSIAFTLKAIQSSNNTPKIGYWIGAVTTGWICLALVDYAIGMEIFRFLCVYVLMTRNSEEALLQKLLTTARAWAWSVLIPLGFVAWRVLFFQNERKATDIGLQLSGLFSSPFNTLAAWFLQFFNSILNMSVLAWVGQFPRFLFGLRLRDIALGFIVAGCVLLVGILVERFLDRQEHKDQDAAPDISREALLIGIPGMFLGILPIIMANRGINLDGFSHYALPASLAAALTLTGLLYALAVHVRVITLHMIVVFAALAHYGISISALNEENAIEKFWWQVSWRVPALEAGTTLVIHYPSGNMGDDGNGVVQAPNMIYFPQSSPQVPVHYDVSAVTLQDSNLQEVMTGKISREVSYRSHSATIDFGNILVLSQPTPSSCVHVIDGTQPLISIFDPGKVILASSSSDIENVVADTVPFTPQEFAFGREPEHKWCYYFEKAELALQLENWNQAASLGEEAIRLGLHPEDQSEWLPFLKAYALTGNEKRVKQTALKINTDTFLRLQACDLLSNLEAPLTPEIEDLISTLYCRNTE
jgi:hypothetical protein